MEWQARGPPHVHILFIFIADSIATWPLLRFISGWVYFVDVLVSAHSGSGQHVHHRQLRGGACV